jgi:hypothetical protein
LPDIPEPERGDRVERTLLSAAFDFDLDFDSDLDFDRDLGRLILTFASDFDSNT